MRWLHRKPSRPVEPLEALGLVRQKQPSETWDEFEQRVALAEDRLVVSILSGENRFHLYLPNDQPNGSVLWAHLSDGQCPACIVVAAAWKRISEHNAQASP